MNEPPKHCDWLRRALRKNHDDIKHSTRELRYFMKLWKQRPAQNVKYTQDSNIVFILHFNVHMFSKHYRIGEYLSSK